MYTFSFCTGFYKLCCWYWLGIHVQMIHRIALGASWQQHWAWRDTSGSGRTETHHSAARMSVVSHACTGHRIKLWGTKGTTETRLPVNLQVDDESKKHSFYDCYCELTVIPWQWSLEEKQALVRKKKETGLRLKNHSKKNIQNKFESIYSLSYPGRQLKSGLIPDLECPIYIF